jgi:hypothetical protein
MQSNYVSTTKDGTGREPTIQELLAFGRSDLKANYLLWTRDDAGHYKEVLKVLRWPNQTQDSAGGLDTGCPTAFASCARGR